MPIQKPENFPRACGGVCAIFGIMNIEAIAKIMYSTYCHEVGGKAFNGDPLPDWATFRADPKKLKQSSAWVAAAQAGADALNPAEF